MPSLSKEAQRKTKVATSSEHYTAVTISAWDEVTFTNEKIKPVVL